MRQRLFSIPLLIMLLSSASSAEDVRKIEVKGAMRIERDTILAQGNIHPGDDVNQEKIDEVVQRLFDTGFFQDVHIHIRKGLLTIDVKENPIASNIIFEGNTQVDDEIFTKELGLHRGKIFTYGKLREDVKLISDIYRLKGFFTAKITPQIVHQDQNRVSVIFKIEEGHSTGVQKILFFGNKAFSDSVLKEQIQTEETKWYRFWGGHDSYDPDRLSYDQELLRNFYLRNGYVDFEVKSVITELTKDKKDFYITFTVDEHERYKFGDIQIDSSIPKLDASELNDKLLMSKDQWYNKDLVENTVTALTEAVGNSGFAFVDITPKVTKNSKDNVINITFDIQEGPKVFINRIVIKGNQRTNENVIRRELLIAEGDAYNTHKIDRSKRQIRNLGFFRNVKIQQRPAPAGDMVDLEIEVEEEDSTGELSVGAGFSTSDGLLGDLKIVERNLMGKGQEISFATVIAKRKRELSLSFTEPRFLERDIRAGFTIQNTRTNRYHQQLFKQHTTGLKLFMAYALAEDLYQKVYYNIRSDKMTDVDEKAPKSVKKQKGTSLTSSVGHTVTYDRTDNAIAPRKGYYIGFGNEFAGLGGDARHFKTDLFGGYYYPITSEITFKLSGNIGYMVGVGKKVRVTDRYSLGGQDLRGFEDGGAGPVDKETKKAVGGLKYYSGTAEVVFPLGLPKEMGFQMGIFTDIGGLWHTEKSSNKVIDDKSMRMSAGVAFYLKTPMGPLNFSFGKALKKGKHDSTQVFRIGYGTR